MILKIIKDGNFIDRHLKNNALKYLIIFLIFVIGIVLGLIYLKSVDDLELNKYIDNLVLGISDENNINFLNVFKQNCFKNFLIFILCVIASLSIIGVPILFIYIAYRGFALGVTVSAMICTYGKLESLFFSMILLYLPNMIMFLGITFLLISSLKFVQNIFMMKKDIKMEVTRHLIVVMLFGIVICVSIFLESILAPIAVNVLV